MFHSTAEPFPTAANASHALDTTTLWTLSGLALVMGGLAVLCGLLAVKKAQDVFGIEQRDYEEEEDEIDKHAAVIAVLSYKDDLGDPLEKYGWLTANGLADVKNNLDDFCNDTSNYWKDHPYQHIIRAWKHHFIINKEKEYIPPLFIITSEKSKGRKPGSDNQIGQFRKVVGKLFSGYIHEAEAENFVLNPTELRSRDFENFEDMRETLWAAYKDFAKPEIEKRIRGGNWSRCEAQIKEPIIDVTGGQRTVAIAAAAVTLGKNVRGFSYVSQNERKLKYYKLVPVKQEMPPAHF
jgi:hypothetical protein